MLLVGMIQWWYTRGWQMFFAGLKNQLLNAADFFSIRLLVENLFAPFRQISATESASSSSLSVQISVFFDKLLSRVIGAVVRLILLIIGTVLIILQAVAGCLIAILWPLAPVLVVGCVVLAVMGVSF